MAYPLMRHMHARVCTSFQFSIFNKQITFNPYPAVDTITDSTRKWPLLKLPTLPTAGEREQGRNKQSKVCMHM